MGPGIALMGQVMWEPRQRLKVLVSCRLTNKEEVKNQPATSVPNVLESQLKKFRETI
jgi:hypothetical protein